MAKKQEVKVEVEQPQIQEEVVVMEQPKIKTKSDRYTSTDLEENWEIRDRQYYLAKDLTPLSTV